MSVLIIEDEQPKHYLVTLNLILGEIEKTARHLVAADSEDEAGTIALTGECHDEPDFEGYPDKQACWDMGQYVYRIYDVQLVEADELPVLQKYIGCW